MALSDIAARNARATGKEYTLADYDGLSLRVTAEGSRAWHFRYSWLGKQKRMSLGTYPEVTLRQARALRDEARALSAKGVNPRADRKKQRHVVRLAGENTFDAVYQKWLAYRQLSLEEGRQTSLGQIRRVFKRDVLPLLRGQTIYEITRQHLLEVIGRIEARKSLSVAEKVRTWFRQLFEYATVVIPGMEANPATSLHAVAVPLPPVQHNPFLRIAELPAFLQTLRKYPGDLQTQLAVRLLLLTGVRTIELRLSTPEQFDLERRLWTIPAPVVKQLKLQMRRKRLRPDAIPPYLVPLSVQAVEIVRHLLEQVRPAQHYLFPNLKCLKEPMSENTVNMALKRIGYGDLLTGHGIRGTISTALNELGYPNVWIDAQLSHADPNRIRASYNHAENCSSIIVNAPCYGWLSTDCNPIPLKQFN